MAILTSITTEDLSNTESDRGVRLDGQTADAEIGAGFQTLGDVNGDGVTDFLLSGFGVRSGSGGQYVFTDGFDAILTLDDIFSSNSATDQSVFLQPSGVGERGNLGTVVGDINNDGFDDIVFSANAGGSSQQGLALIAYGGTAFDPAELAATLTLDQLGDVDGLDVVSFGGPNNNARLGVSVAGLGDVNGDGIDDWAIGGSGAGTSFEGQVTVIYGGADLSNINTTNSITNAQGFTISGNSNRVNLAEVGGIGDINGDGINDIIVGAPAQSNSNSIGTAYVVFGEDGITRSDFDITNTGNWDGFTINQFAGTRDRIGERVEILGDIDGDGFDDFAVSAPRADPGGRSDGGIAFVIYGRDNNVTGSETIVLADLTAEANMVGFRVNGESAGDNLGLGLAAIGDVNGDGLADLAVGGPSNDGQVLVIYGNSTRGTFGRGGIEASDIRADGSLGFVVDGVANDNGDLFGEFIHGLGDVNNDGFDDFSISNRRSDFDAEDGGSTYIVYGGESAVIKGTSSDDVLLSADVGQTVQGLGGNDTLLGDGARSLTLESSEGELFRAYQAVFDRAPDAGGFNAFLTEIRLGNTTQEDVITEFVESAEFENTYGNLNDADFVAQLFRNVLDREGDTGGLAAFTEALGDGRSRASVVIEFANSAEFVQLMTLPSAAFATNVIIHPAEAQVFRIYQAVFLRDPDEAGFTAFTNSIQAGVLTVEEITAEFVGSEEFQLTYGALDNTDFVELLFTNVLPGNMDAQGRADFVEALNSETLTRETMVAEFVETFEFVQRMESPSVEFVSDVFTDAGDTLDGGTGDDVLFGGRGADQFIYDTETGDADIILDFTSGTDSLDLGDNAAFDTFAEIMAAGTQAGLDTVFDFGDGNTLTLENVVLSELTEEDFGFDVRVRISEARDAKVFDNPVSFGEAEVVSDVADFEFYDMFG